MKKILVLCTGNSCRSQMAEGYLREYSAQSVEIYSAGIEAHGVNPKAIESMKRDGIDISAHTSNKVDEYQELQFDYVITVCDNASENCPYFPGIVRRIHQNFPDPSKAKGTEEEFRNQFDKVRDSIREFARLFVSSTIATL